MMTLTKFSFSVIFLSAIMLLTNCNSVSDHHTRGIGIYPGNPAEDFSPVMTVDSVTYRNLALNRASYHSSSYDYNLTAQLITDGIKDSRMPYRMAVSTNQHGELSRNMREVFFDHFSKTSVNIENSSAWVQFELLDGNVPTVDRIELSATLRIDLNAPRGWSCKIMGSENKKSWKQTGFISGKGYPAPRLEWSPGNFGPEELRSFNASINFKEPVKYRFYRIEMQSPNALNWNLSVIDFFDQGEKVEIVPSHTFTSAWMSGGIGEEWVITDLGAVCSFDKINLSWIKRAKVGAILVSNNKADWRIISEWMSDECKSDEFIYDTPITGRYVKILMRQPESPDGYVLSELEVFGRGGEIPIPKDTPKTKDRFRIDLAGGSWKIQRASLTNTDGTQISRKGYNDSKWIVATVPGTALMSYKNIGALPDPNYADNQLMISESFFNSDFWYRKEFEIPSLMNNDRVYINFDGINWKANVFFNGRNIGRIEGAFMRAKFDVSQYILNDQKNTLAVHIIKNDYPGIIKEQTALSPDKNGGVLGADNPTFHATIGWDWIPTIRGRNIGIWNDVYISHSGTVTIEDPYVKTDLPLPDTSYVDLSFTFKLQNHENSPVEGTVRGKFGDISFSHIVSMEPLETKEIYLDPSIIPTLKLHHPKLWWPNGYGHPYLYDVSITFIPSDNNKESDKKTFKAGVRELTYKEDNNILKIWVNGRRLIGRGGNWGFSESNLSYRSREYDIAVRLHKENNFNLIRNWVGQTGHTDFFKACDKYGIMVWQDFWLANPFDGPNPDDHELFMKNASDFIKRIRHHPSIVLYCGRNEGYPPSYLDFALQSEVKKLHPGSHYISNSARDVVSGFGPYRALPVKYYFEQRANLKTHSEIGRPNIVSLESLRKMMPDSTLWPQGRMWGVHDFTEEGPQGGVSFRQIINDNYGGADNVLDWVNLAQFVNYEGYRAIFEAQSRHRMGTILWMSHPAWPSLVWQTYDYYFEPTAAYFGCKKGSEPLHIQWNMLTDSIEVVNYSVKNGNDLDASAKIYNMDGSLKWQKRLTLNCSEDNTVRCFKMEYPADLSDVHFIRLRLKRGDNLISDNFYWRGKEENIYTALKTLPKVKIESKTKFSRSGSTWHLTTHLRNTSKSPALMIRLKTIRSKSGDRILPVLYSDNYISLLPGESKTIHIEIDDSDTRGENPAVDVSGFNLEI